VATPAKARNHFAQDIQESPVILIVLKDRFLAVTARGNLVKSAGGSRFVMVVPGGVATSKKGLIQ